MKQKKLGIKSFLEIFRNVKLPWVFLIISVACTIANYLFTLNLAQLTSDVVNASGDVENAKLISYIIAAVVVVVGSSGSIWFSGIAAEKINLSLRKKLWSKMMRLPRSRYDSDKGESLVSRITTDCKFSSVLFTMLVSILSGIVGICIYYVELFSSNASISMLSILILPVSVLIGWAYGKLCYAIGKSNQERLGEATSYLIERTYNTALIKAANMQDAESKLGVEKFESLYKIEIKKGFAEALNTFINAAMPLVSMAVVFIAGAKFVNSGLMTAGGVYAFYLVAKDSAVLFANLVTYFGSIRESVGAMVRVTETLKDAEEDLQSGETAPEKEAVSLQDVSFAYGEKSILDHLTVEIPRNKLTVIVGANGAGKSTMFRLLERFYPVGSGSIHLGNQDAVGYSLESWRRTVGLMPQDCVLMAGTIRSNLSMGAEEFYTDEALDAVFAQLGMKEWIDTMPQRYDTPVETGGSNFSGGQKQILGMARVLLYDPYVLLLDEATSNLDAKCASQVREALSKLRENRTIVMIAHDLNTILSADYAIILRDGKAAFSGSPRQVLDHVYNYRHTIMNG